MTTPNTTLTKGETARLERDRLADLRAALPQASAVFTLYALERGLKPDEAFDLWRDGHGEIRAQAADEWRRKPELHTEFSECSDYEAFRVAEATGTAKGRMVAG